MPAAYVGAAMAVAQGVSSMTSDSGSAPQGTNNRTGVDAVRDSLNSPMLAGGLANSLNPPQAQTSPGSYSPASNLGEGYNYIPTGQGSIDQLIQQILQGQAGRPGGSVLPDASGLASGGGSTYAPSWAGLTAPGSAGQRATDLLQITGNNATNAGSGLSSFALGQLPNLQQLITQAFDPQSALYSRTAGRLQDQVRAGEAARGLATSPYGAGIENKAMSDFNIDWEGAQLARALQGIQGLSSGLGGIGGALNTGTGMQRAGSQDWANSAILQPELYMRTAGDAQGLLANQQRLQAGEQAMDLAPLTPALNYMQGARESNRLSNQVADTQATRVGNQNANAAAGISSGMASAMPWIGQGLGGLYDSIFGKSKGTGTDYQAGYGAGSDYSGVGTSDGLNISADTGYM